MNEQQLKDNYEFEKIIGDKILDSLPGIFYIYELIDGDFKMVKWNKNHEILTEYVGEENFHKKAIDFFPKKEHLQIEKAVKNVIDNGKGQTFGKVKSKTGKLIPHFFEGYSFKIKKRQFFMGVGVDVSDFFNAKKQLEQERIKRERLLERTRKLNKELLTDTVEKTKKNDMAIYLNQKIDSLLSIDNLEAIKTELLDLKSFAKQHIHFEKNWSIFKEQFTEIHKNFFSKLNRKHPNLTLSEIKFCAYLKMNMSSEQIASLINISQQGIKQKRYRLRKKLGLARNQSLENHITDM